jgi:two-component SAPR family response regulator
MTKTKEKILIVEDEVLNAIYLKKELEKRKYHICKIASTAKQAIDIFKTENPGYAIIDINLAGQTNGIELAKMLQAESNVHIVFISGFSKDEWEKELQSFSPLHWLNKPINLQLLLEKIQRAD